MILFASNQAFFSAYFQADFFGKLIFYALFALSIVCWVVLIHKTLQMKKTKTGAILFEDLFKKNKEKLLNFSPESKLALHPFAQVFQPLCL